MEVGQEGVISVSYVNKGFSSLYNMEASLELENADSLQPVVYAGNVESGKSGTIDFVVTPFEEGEYTGEIILKYENSSQKEELVTIPLKFNSTMAYVAEDFFYDEAEAETEETNEAAISPAVMTGAGGAVLALVIVIIMLIARKKKKNRERSEEDLNDWFNEGSAK